MSQVTRALVTVLLALGTVFLFFLVLTGFGDREPDRALWLARSQFALRAAAQVAGLVVAVAALLGLLQHAARGAPAGDLSALGLCVLGGVLVAEPHWAVALTFGLLALARVVERVVGPRGPSPGPTGGSG